MNAPQETTRYGHGSIAWTELVTRDLDGQRSFYSRLFEWRFDDMYRARSNVSGKPVSGLRRCFDGPPGWVPFIAVDDVDVVRRAVKATAGAVRADGELQDPLGGRFFAWDGRAFEGPHGLNEPNGLAWNEVWTTDRVATVAFYRNAFGWNLKEQPGPGGAPYTMFAGRDRPSWTHAGIRSFEAGAARARWISYFEVKDCAQSVESARSLGATITLAPTYVDRVGWIATAADPEGSPFGLMQSGG